MIENKEKVIYFEVDENEGGDLYVVFVTKPFWEGYHRLSDNLDRDIRDTLSEMGFSEVEESTYEYNNVNTSREIIEDVLLNYYEIIFEKNKDFSDWIFGGKDDDE